MWHWVQCSLCPVLKLNTALVKVANKLREEGDITMRQLESEKKKSPSKRASGKIELLKKKLAEVCTYACMSVPELFTVSTWNATDVQSQLWSSIILNAVCCTYVRTYVHYRFVELRHFVMRSVFAAFTLGTPYVPSLLYTTLRTQLPSLSKQYTWVPNKWYSYVCCSGAL